MKRWKKIVLCLWASAPFITIANFRNIEMLAIDRAYANKECQTEHLKIRENDYQQRYDEGFKRGVEVAKYGARAEAFTILMDLIERSGLSKEVEEEVKVALTSTTIIR